MSAERVLETSVELSSLPAHLLPLAGDGWAVWRCIGLRSAGFPACSVLRLATDDAAAAADSVLAAEARREVLWAEAGARIEAALDRLRERNEWNDLGQRRPLLDARQAVIKRRLRRGLEKAVGEVAAAALKAAEASVDAAEAAFGEAFTAAIARQSQVLHEVAGWEPFQEAVIWQNRGAFHTAVRRVAERPPAEARRNSQRRQHEDLVASYLQRYSVKNDTIGYFGPMGWASFNERGEALRVSAGTDLLAARETFLEAWAVDRLALSLSRHLAVRQWLKPRLLPFVKLGGSGVLFPNPMSLPPAERALLTACDGRRRAAELAAELVAGGDGFSSSADVYRALERLSAAQLIHWAFLIPQSPWALDALARQVEELGDERLREACAKAVSTLDRARGAVAAAGGDAAELDRSLGKLNETFHRLTGSAAERFAGDIYAGRTVAYEDCRRDVGVDIGPAVLAALRPPLALLLTSARWLTWDFAQRVRGHFEETYLELVRDQGSPVVDALAFWHRIRPLVSEEDTTIVAAARAGLQERWRRLLAIDPDARRVELSSEQLADGVEREFAAPGPGWEHARYHNPDLMILAANAEAVERGDFQLVLGEFHPAMNTLNCWVFVALHPRREAILRSMDIDLPRVNVTFVPNKNNPTRLHAAHLPDKDFIVLPMDRVELMDHPRVLRVEDLVVEHSGEGLIVRHRSEQESFRFDIVQAFGDVLSGLLDFDFLGPSRHWPRITIDRLVVWRECWRFGAEELEFARLKEERERFVGARRWACEHGLPRHLFVRVPVEAKPFYVDLGSPVSVEHLARLTRLTEQQPAADRWVKASEMLPGFGDLWLPDAGDRRYTCELRVLATDRKGLASAASPRGGGR